MMIARDRMTLWELGLRLAGEDPYRLKWLPLSSRAKDAFRNLITEIYEDHMDSSLIMAKKQFDDDVPSEFYVRSHLETILAIQTGKSFPRRFLEFVSIERIVYRDWCDTAGFPQPDFWPELDNDRFFWDYDNEPALRGEPGTRLSKREETDRIKAKVRQLAIAAWDTDPNLTMTDIIHLEDIHKAAPQFQPDTFRRWIRPYAPEHIKGKRGRPRKSE